MPAALFLAFLVIRSALIQAFAGSDISKAAAIWPGHPAITLESGLAEIGELAGAGKPVERSRIDPLLAASTKAPLAMEPFLVRGVAAELAGDQALALRAFLAARQRDPRAIAPRYFLADHYLKAGQSRSGLAEITALARLVPQSLPNVAPFLAAYARSPGAAPQVKAMLEAQPQLETVLLSLLAGDPGNLDLILYLWSNRGGDEARPWQGRLLGGLVEAGRFDDARTAWTRFTGISAERDRLFDAEFMAQAPPPFGWKLASGSAGVAEPQGNGRLHILYYGRDDFVLAGQLLNLPPGRYRLSMQLGGLSPASTSLAWTLKCLPAATIVVTVPLDRAGARVVPVMIPEGCPGQQLELVGHAPEFPETAEATVGQLRLQREARR